jgi:hypothetical protein
LKKSDLGFRGQSTGALEFLQMTRDEYIERVGRVLGEHTDRAVVELVAALALVPANARQVTLDIFVDQDGEGLLNVRVGLDGPDLFVLNRAIESRAQLFSTRMTPAGLVPNLPLMDPFNEEFSDSRIARRPGLSRFGRRVARAASDCRSS